MCPRRTVVTTAVSQRHVTNTVARYGPSFQEQGDAVSITASLEMRLSGRMLQNGVSALYNFNLKSGDCSRGPFQILMPSSVSVLYFTR